MKIKTNSYSSNYSYFLETKTDRYINENLRELKEDWIIIQANIGSGKTTSLYQLYEQSVLSIGARNSLGLQTMEKHPSILSEHHLKDLDKGYTKSKSELLGIKRYRRKTAGTLYSASRWTLRASLSFKSVSGD